MRSSCLGLLLRRSVGLAVASAASELSFGVSSPLLLLPGHPLLWIRLRLSNFVGSPRLNPSQRVHLSLRVRELLVLPR